MQALTGHIDKAATAALQGGRGGNQVARACDCLVRLTELNRTLAVVM